MSTRPPARDTPRLRVCGSPSAADSAAHRTGQALSAGSASAHAPAPPRTFFRPWKRWAWRAAIATVPNTQKPMGPAATAWCPARPPQTVSSSFMSLAIAQGLAGACPGRGVLLDLEARGRQRSPGPACRLWQQANANTPRAPPCTAARLTAQQARATFLTSPPAGPHACTPAGHARLQHSLPQARRLLCERG